MSTDQPTPQQLAANAKRKARYWANREEELAKRKEHYHTKVGPVKREIAYLNKRIRWLNTLRKDYTKRCPACGLELPRSAFGYSSIRLDRLSAYCKRCRKKTRWIAPKEKTAANAKAWRARNADKVREAKERRRLGLLGRKIEVINYDRLLEMYGMSCHVCGEELAHPIQLDHLIPVNKGGEHTYANVRLTHARCNRWKWDKVLVDILPDIVERCLERR